MGRPEGSIGYGVDSEPGLNDSQETLVVKPIQGWRGYLWDTWELPKDQRWLLFKLDAFVLTFASVSFPHFQAEKNANMEMSDRLLSQEH
jgi:ACS family pantothenate transporter-like MFS transporter